MAGRGGASQAGAALEPRVSRWGVAPGMAVSVTREARRFHPIPPMASSSV